jgi:hypothetical protein
MGSDLVATILDADHDTIEVDIDYALPGETGDLIGHAKSARVWLDSAQQLWQERATVAARTLAGQGYSLRDVAVRLGLPINEWTNCWTATPMTSRPAPWWFIVPVRRTREKC